MSLDSMSVRWRRASYVMESPVQIPHTQLKFIISNISEENTGVRETSHMLRNTETTIIVTKVQPSARRDANRSGGSAHIHESSHWIVQQHVKEARFVTVKVTVFRDVTKCNLVGTYRHFGGTWCAHLQGRRANVGICLPNNTPYKAIFTSKSCARPGKRYTVN
jgi:flavin-dependent dehydrogenase